MSKPGRRQPIPLLLPEFNRVESPYIEPGLLPVFRLALTLQIVLQLVSVGVLILVAPTSNWRAWCLWSSVWLLLLLYLCSPTLPYKLGRAYLPVALITVSFAHILERALFLRMEMQQAVPQMTGKDLLSIGWHLLFVLLIPLVLIAWQYNFRWVLAYSIGTTVLNQMFAFWFSNGKSLWQPELAELSLIGALMFTVLGYIIVCMMRAQREQRHALIEANTKLVDFTATAERLAVSRERNRLARDLHDTLAHTLSAVSVQLEAVDSVWEQTPAQARPLLVKSLATARSGLAETRRAIQALRAAPLDDLGLALALRNLAESTSARTGAKLVLNIADELTVPPDLEQNIYRVAQEALANITEHANAQQIGITLGKQNDAVVLTVTDDGVGFSPDKLHQAGHYGLQGMKERARLMGARLEITSQPGKGATVWLRIDKSSAAKKRTGEKPNDSSCTV